MSVQQGERRGTYVRREQASVPVMTTVYLTSREASALYSEARRLGMDSSELIAELVGKVVSDNLVDAVLDR